MEVCAASTEMQQEVDKMATTFLDQIGLQSSKTTATSEQIVVVKTNHSSLRSLSLSLLVKGLCLSFLGLLCKSFPEHMKKYTDPLLLGQYLKYLHEQVNRC